MTRATLGLAGLLIVLAFAWATLTPSTAGPTAAPGGDYRITWFTVNGGGGESAGGRYTLVGAVGQPEAGLSMSGGGYALAGGFWGRPVHHRHRSYLPMIEVSLTPDLD
jgi:hypothetical protein